MRLTYDYQTPNPRLRDLEVGDFFYFDGVVFMLPGENNTFLQPTRAVKHTDPVIVLNLMSDNLGVLDGSSEVRKLKLIEGPYFEDA